MDPAQSDTEMGYECIKNSRLLGLPWALIGVLWPAERVIVGLRTCRSLRKELASHAQSIYLVRSCKETVAESQLVVDLLRFSRNRVSLKWEYLNSSCENLLKAMTSSNFMPALCYLRLQARLRTDAALLAGVLRSCVSLVHLDLGANEMGPDGMRKLAPALAECRQLEHLNLSRNYLLDDGAGELGEVLGECKALVYLNLWWNEIGPAGAGKIARAVAQCQGLMHLNLSLNQIGDSGAQTLAHALSTCHSLTHLNLYGNGIGDLGAAHLADAVAACSALVHLDVTMNDIGAEGAQRLAVVVRGREEGQEGAKECRALVHHTLLGRRWCLGNGDAGCADRGEARGSGVVM
eukprot:3227599-Rhodomonas_salina.4